jgi:hypothetical protein
MLAMMFGGWFIALALWLIAIIAGLGIAFRKYRSES